MSRNEHLHTSAQQAERNIVAAMQAAGATHFDRSLLMSAIGYSAFPGYRFKKPQGAALAVSKIASGMVDRKVLAHGRRGLYLLQKPAYQPEVQP